MTVFRWSQTAASNATADSSINARENQAPSTINDAMRGMMAAVAKWRDDLSGNLVTGGTSSAYTITSNQVYATLTDGIYVKARMNATNAAGATLNVDGLGAKTIATVYGTPIRAGALRLGGVYEFVYDSTDDKWIAVSAPDNGVKTGEIKAYAGTTAPDGYVRANGRTIGNAASGASERANADTADLYTLLWNSYADGVCAVSSGRGASAAADYAANKTIALPDLRGRGLFGLDDMGNSAASRLGTIITTATTNGASGGAETVTLTRANLPNDTVTPTVTITDPGHAHNLTFSQVSGSGPTSFGGSLTRYTSQNDTTDGAISKTTGITATSSFNLNGGVTQTATSNMPPAFLTTFIIKL